MQLTCSLRRCLKVVDKYGFGRIDIELMGHRRVENTNIFPSVSYSCPIKGFVPYALEEVNDGVPRKIVFEVLRVFRRLSSPVPSCRLFLDLEQYSENQGGQVFFHDACLQ